MKTIKNFIAPVKIFISVAFSIVLALLTMIVLVPVTTIYNISIETNQTIFITATVIYLISTVMYLFKNSRHVK